MSRSLRKKFTPKRPSAESANHIALAEWLLDAGRYAEAVGPLLEAVGLVPNDAGVLNDLGVAYMATRRFREAVIWLKRSIALQPNVGNSHYNLGLALQHLGDDEAALVEHRRAVALCPELTGAHVQLADLLWEKGMREAAVAEYKRTYACAPTTTVGRLGKIKALDAQHRSEEAEQRLRELIALDASSSLAHTLLGRLLQEAGRFGEATMSFERAVALDPWQTNAYYGLVSSRRLTEDDRPLVARIASRLDIGDWDETFGPALAQRHRMMLHFAIGKAHDDLGEYPLAMRHFYAANAIRRELVPFERHDVEQTLDELIARFTPEFFASHSAMGHDDETPLLIVGLPRSGTTLLERIVSNHHAVAGWGELDFWSEHGPVWSNSKPDRLAKVAGRLQASYLRVLRERVSGAVRVTDKMPFNFFWVGLVHLLLPKARFLFSVRNPVDTCLSIYTTPLHANLGFASAFGDLAWYHRLHLRLIDHWRAVLPPDRWLDVHYEDVVGEPEKTARRLIAFCGLEWDPACLRPEDNPNEVRTASSWQARQPIYQSSVERWRRYEPWLSELRALL
jgi:tetratricopeptide (TPR) repeat protein